MVPGEESVEFAIGPVVGDALQGQFEPGLRIDVIELGGREQCGKGRPCSSAAVRSGEERIFARDGLGADGPLDDVVIDIDPAVMKEALEIGAAPQSISDRVGQFGFAGDALQLRLPALEQFERRSPRRSCAAPPGRIWGCRRESLARRSITRPCARPSRWRCRTNRQCEVRRSTA